nr:hypothetical protein [uncultured Flavobacterium sp.]
MGKIIGYFLRIISILFFIVLAFGVINSLRNEELENQDSAYIFGYLLGTFLGLGLLGLLNYLLFKFSGKLIAYKKVKNELDDIGKDAL